MRFSWNHGLWPEATAAAVASLAVAWPLTTLLQGTQWIGPAIIPVLLIGLVGGVLRSFRVDQTVVVLGQTLAAVAYLLWRYLADTLLWVVVPGPETLSRAADLLRDAGLTLQTYAAPAPVNEGVEFLVVAVLALTATAVDGIGVTGRAPATAGIPLATAFLVSVSNNGQAMAPWFFAVAAIAWLIMVAQQNNRLVGGWSSADRQESVGSHDVSYGPTGHRSVARVLGVISVLAALVLASVVPHLPPTFLADGLGRSPESGSDGGTGQVSFTETMDVTADLRNQSDAPVINYESTPGLDVPLRVTATSEFDGGTWQPPEPDPGSLQSGLLRPPDALPEGMGEDIPTSDGQIEVLTNGLRPPHLAVPTPLSSVRAETGMRFDSAQAAVRVDSAVDEYAVEYLQVAPRAGLPDGVGEPVDAPGGFEGTLELDEAGMEAFATLSDEVVGDTTNHLEIGQLLQNHLRSGLYSYNLELAPGMDPDDPISHFLETRQGYCVQFATAMVMMARYQGIPARMAVGFLPGELQTDGSYTVVASDAHTWPELWIDGMGWTRFEPTPGIRTGLPPAYTQLDQAQPEADPTPTQTAEATPTAEEESPSTADTDQSWTDSVVDALRSLWPVLQRALIVIVALAVLMLLLGRAGRRHRSAMLRQARTPQERIEGEWELMVRSLQDYGVDPPQERSPREMAAHYGSATRLTTAADEALDRASATLERSRYAPSSQLGQADDSAMHEDVRRVVDEVADRLPWNMRLSARLFPRSGWSYLRSLVAGGFSRRRG